VFSGKKINSVDDLVNTGDLLALNRFNHGCVVANADGDLWQFTATATKVGEK
jgi:hypothetical protein